MNLTTKEKKMLIEELSSRMKDIVYMRAVDKAMELIEKTDFESINSEDTLVFTYEIVFVANDIFQILGRLRR